MPGFASNLKKGHPEYTCYIERRGLNGSAEKNPLGQREKTPNYALTGVSSYNTKLSQTQYPKITEELKLLRSLDAQATTHGVQAFQEERPRVAKYESVWKILNDRGRTVPAKHKLYT